MKLLVVDDDLKEREAGVIAHWTLLNNGIKPECEWWTDFHWTFVNHLLFHPEIDCLSLDNDLGHQDVMKELNYLAWNDTVAFTCAMRNKKIIIHSMNLPAANNIKSLLDKFCSDVTIIPYSTMLPDPERSETYE
jgi:hypothetical protein